MWIDTSMAVCIGAEGEVITVVCVIEFYWIQVSPDRNCSFGSFSVGCFIVEYLWHKSGFSSFFLAGIKPV